MKLHPRRALCDACQLPERRFNRLHTVQIATSNALSTPYRVHARTCTAAVQFTSRICAEMDAKHQQQADAEAHNVTKPLPALIHEILGPLTPHERVTAHLLAPHYRASEITMVITGLRMDAARQHGTAETRAAELALVLQKTLRPATGGNGSNRL